MSKLLGRNKFEKKLIAQVRRRFKKVEYEPEKLRYTIVGNYIPDIRLPNGIRIEAKGWLRPEDKRKMKAVKASWSELDFRFVFQSYNKKQIAWAEKNGFKWAVGEIPTEWMNE